MKQDRAKLKALVHHILWRTDGYPDFGATKLNKVLWFVEARAFEAFGEPIAGETFIRDTYGPRSKNALRICEELEDENIAVSMIGDWYDRPVKRYRVLAPPDTESFDPHQKILIDYWINEIAENHSAMSISAFSHDYAWKVAAQGEELPPFAYLANKIRPPRSPDEIDWARKEAERLGLN